MTKNANRNSHNGEKDTTPPKPLYQFAFPRRYYAVPFSPKWPIGIILLLQCFNPLLSSYRCKNVFRQSPVVALRRHTLTLTLNPDFETNIYLSDSLQTYFAGNKNVLFNLKIHKDAAIMLCFLFNFTLRFINSTVTCQCKQFFYSIQSNH